MMQSKRNISRFGVLLECLAAVGIIANVLFVATAWAALPSLIPVHFDLTGSPDSTGNKSDLLLLLGLSLASYFGLTLLGRFPQKFNYPWTITEANSEYQYGLASTFVKMIKVQLVWMFAFISLNMISASANGTGGLGAYFVVLILMLSGASFVGYLLLASRSSFHASNGSNN